MEETSLLVALLAAAAVATFALFVWSTLSGRSAVERRVERFAKSEPAALAQDQGGGRRGAAVRHLEQQDRQHWLSRRLARELARARDPLTPRSFAALCGALGVGLFALLAVASGQLPVALAAAILGSAAPVGWLRMRHGRLLSAFNAQLAGTMTLLTSAVRAGNSLPQALERVAREAPEPARSAFDQIVREVGLGVSVEEALEGLARTYPSEDLDVLVTAIGVQYQVGGNLLRVLELLAETIIDRARLSGDVEALTSSQRYSAYILAGLPVFAGVALFLFSPDYLSVMFEPGPLRFVVVIDVFLIVLGFVVMQRVARVEL